MAAVSRVIGNLGRPAFAIAYAAGFACGNFTGLTIEALVRHRSPGRARFRDAAALAERLRTCGFLVTFLKGKAATVPSTCCC